MNNEKMNQIIDDAYTRYTNHWGFPIHPANFELYTRLDLHPDKRLFTKEEFVDRCQTNDEFSSTWGLKIKERELSLEERTELLKDRSDFKKDFYDRNGKLIVEEKRVLDESNIPTRAITVTYKNETIEVYE